MFKVRPDDVVFNPLRKFKSRNEQGKVIEENNKYVITTWISLRGLDSLTYFKFITGDYTVIDIDGILVDMYVGEIIQNRVRLISVEIFEEV